MKFFKRKKKKTAKPNAANPAGKCPVAHGGDNAEQKEKVIPDDFPNLSKGGECPMGFSSNDAREEKPIRSNSHHSADSRKSVKLQRPLSSRDALLTMAAESTRRLSNSMPSQDDLTANVVDFKVYDVMSGKRKSIGDMADDHEADNVMPKSDFLQDMEKIEEEKQRDGEATVENNKNDALIKDKQSENDVYRAEANRVLGILDETYGAGTGFRKAGDEVVVTEGWNKALAFVDSWNEAMAARWRIEVAFRQIVEERSEEEHKMQRDPARAEEKKRDEDLGELNGEELPTGLPSKDVTSSKLSMPSIERESILKENLSAWREALEQVENKTDPLAEMLGTRIDHLRTLLTGIIDAAVRTLSPKTQRIQREAYRPMSDDLLLGDGLGAAAGQTSELQRFALTEGTVEEYSRLFCRCGVQPKHWLAFVDAFLWTMRTHNPYADDTDSEDLELPNDECAHSIFCASHICRPCIQGSLELRDQLASPLFKICLRRFWKRVISGGDAAMAAIGETFYRQLLTNHPELLDYFAKADMDSLAVHLVMALDLLVKSIEMIGSSGTQFRHVLDHLGEMHRRLGIPTFSFPIVGGQLLKTLRPLLEEEESLTVGDEIPSSAEDLEQAFAVLYMEIMALVYYPMVREEKLVNDAEEFFISVAKELNWSPDKLNKRLLEVKLEINTTGTYIHTSEELEIGARLSWRNSAKCIGRIAWNTLEVRDCRHVEKPEEVFKEVEEHLRIATCGTNIQSVMTVFKPKSTAETWGHRFWSSQFVRYAGYAQEDGTVMGDPANVEFTSYIVERELWEPPENKTHFDVLPLVYKVPGVQKPYVYQLPKEFVHEVHIEHPTCPAVKDLGLRWASVPAISNFNMNLGGIDYQCCPFNGWFVSIEVVRNLMERYKVQDRWADAMGIDKTQKMLDMRLQHEIQIAVLHSFENQGFTMVDPEQVGASFFVHCKRERDQGRECPAQWSWIGGLVGPTNVTWHKEMRDFKVLPQYEYCCEAWLTTSPSDQFGAGAELLEDEVDNDLVASDSESANGLPRVLILYGSETGTAEAVAARLCRALKLLKPTLACLNEVAGLTVVKEQRITHILAICSTFNRGEFPANAQKFNETDIEPGLLKDTKVAVCALGSSLYPDFCRAGITLDQKLAKAGAQTFASFMKVDDATGSEGPLSDWAKLVQRLVLPKHLEAQISASFSFKADTTIEHKLAWKEPTHEANKVERFTHVESSDKMLCVCNDELIHDGNVKERSTRKISFRLPEGVKYESGDHLAVYPLNSIDAVMRFARIYKEELLEAASVSGACPCDVASNEDTALAWQLQQPFSVETTENGETFDAKLVCKTASTMGDALQTSFDLTLRASLVTDLISSIKNKIEEEMPGLDENNSKLRMKLLKWYNLIIGGSNNMKHSSMEQFLSEFPTVIDFLGTFGPLLCSKTGLGEEDKKVILPLADILTMLPRLQARHYSISSSPRDDPSIVSITVGVVNVQTSAGVWINGVCSNYLARLHPNHDFVLCSIRTSCFRGPEKLSSSVVMIGAGTGLAPMMGFLADRALNLKSCADAGKIGACHLYFGCRNEKDRIYSTTITKWEETGVLEHHLAFSREPNVPKTYVQDLLEQTGKNLCQLLLLPEAHYYICGDAKVADYCFEACILALRTHGNMSRVAAVQHIKRMRAQERWQYDLWGIISHFNEAKQELKKKKETCAKTWLLTFAD